MVATVFLNVPDHRPLHPMLHGRDDSTPSGRHKARGPVILQVLPSLVSGGAERGCVDVAAAIVAAGGTALVASTGGPMVRELPRQGAEHITLPLGGKNPFAIRANAGRLARLIGERGVDLVHARSRAPAWSALSACRRCGVPFVTTFHAAYNFGNPLKKLYNAVMARGERVIAISDFVAGHIRDEYGTDPERIRVIPRGIDLGRFNPAAVSAERVVQLARRWRLPEDRPVILMPGRLTRLKGQLVLLEALARLGRSDLRCLIVGSDYGRRGYRRELERTVARLGLGGVVHLADHCDDMPAAYKLSDVVVCPTLVAEGFGRTVIEAQALGRPVIATDLGGPRETVLEGETGWLVPPGDPAALAAALQRALALDPAARTRLAERAIAFVGERFERNVMTAATLAVYDELLAKDPMHRPLVKEQP